MRCYAVLASRDSTLDHYSNTWSIFHLVDSVQVDEFPRTLAFHLFAGFEADEDEVDQEFAVRSVLLEGKDIEWRGPTHQGRLTATRLRVRIRQLPVARPGHYHIGMEWRFPEQDEEWTLSDIRWPMHVEAQEPEEDGDG